MYALTLSSPGKPGLQQLPADDKLCEDPTAEHSKAKGDPYLPVCQLVVFYLSSTGLRRMRIMDWDSMAEIAGQLRGPMARTALLDPMPVVDQTGLSGHYDLSVDLRDGEGER